MPGRRRPPSRKSAQTDWIERAQGNGRDAAVQPVAAGIVGAIGPEIGARREMPGRAAHPRPRGRCGRRPPSGRHRRDDTGLWPPASLQYPPCTVTRALCCIRSSRAPRREIGQQAFRGLRIDEDVGLVRALVDGRAADLGEPDRLRLAAPRPSALPALDAARPVEMRVRPPGLQVLVAEDPRLAIGPVGDRRARLRARGRPRLA